jgi:Protein of unknown function (DUF3298)
MFKQFFSTAFILFVFAFFACKRDKSAAANAAGAYTIDSFDYKFSKCLSDSVCAKLLVHIPVFKGAALPPALSAINDSLYALARFGTVDYEHLPLKEALDSSGVNLYKMMQEGGVLTASGLSQSVYGITSLVTEKIISVSVEAEGYTGGAHGYYAMALASYDLATGKSIPLTEAVRDTAALVPLLEKGFLAAKNSDEPGGKLEEFLFPEFKHLPVTPNYCIEKEGLRFYYNPYEVGPWAIGGTDILLSWEQLGGLADRKKWVE